MTPRHPSDILRTLLDRFSAYDKKMDAEQRVPNGDDYNQIWSIMMRADMDLSLHDDHHEVLLGSDRRGLRRLRYRIGCALVRLGVAVIPTGRVQTELNETVGDFIAMSF